MAEKVVSITGFDSEHENTQQMDWFPSSWDYLFLLTEIGYYRIAIQMSILADIGMQLVNPVINPQIAKLFSMSDFKGLQQLSITSARITLLFNLVISSGFITLGRIFLGFVYGEEFIAAYIPLIILLIGQLVNAVFGSVDSLSEYDWLRK